MKNNNENRIDETLNSIIGISRAEANPFLFEKISARMNHSDGKFKMEGPQKTISARVKWSWISVCLMVLCINCSSVYYYFQKGEVQAKETAYESIGNEMGLGQNYNY
jgi:hypothetical protein